MTVDEKRVHTCAAQKENEREGDKENEKSRGKRGDKEKGLKKRRQKFFQTQRVREGKKTEMMKKEIWRMERRTERKEKEKYSVWR